MKAPSILLAALFATNATVASAHYYDAETGTDYNYFRDYDPSIGRYVESDPIGLRGGYNTYGYVAAQPLTAYDRLGLLVGFINCSQAQRSTIEQAEQKLRDFFRKHYACPKGEKCVEGNMAEMVLQKLTTNTVECSDFDRITSFGSRMGIWGASAPISGDSTTIYPNLFRSPGSYQCFSAVLFHETMHTLGVEHTTVGPGDDDPVYGTVSKCVRAGLCGGGGS